MNMMDGMLPSPSITEVREKYFGGRTPQAERVRKPEAGSFEAVFQRVSGESSPLKFSRHARTRLESRGIEMTPEQLTRLTGASMQAKEKGISDSLILLDDMAFIVNVPNGTVVTAMDREEGENSIFTNIDGAVIA